jgi:hypothetical protein
MIDALNNNSQQVYDRFCRAFEDVTLEIGGVPMNLYAKKEEDVDATFSDVVTLSREIEEAPIPLSAEKEAEIDVAFDDALALCEEVEDKRPLDYDQIDLLAMLAVANTSDFAVASLFQMTTGENFHD